MHHCWRYPAARFCLLAKAPVAGEVKTRLVPAIGQQRALELHREMTRRTVATVSSAGLAALDLWVSSSREPEFFQTLPGIAGRYLQQGQDLGQRMAWTVRHTLARPDIRQVVLIGADCPALRRDYLEAALAALDDGNDAVIGPAEDGGYVLLGLASIQDTLFRDIHWGSERVLAQTLERAARAGLRHALLEPLWDVDKPSDLERLALLEPPVIY